MASPKLPPPIFVCTIIFDLLLVSTSSDLSLGHKLALGRRGLMSFKEKPGGSNITFECSPSGPCVACLYSEKNDEKYRCSETGYRIPLKCVKIGAGVDEGNPKKTQKGRSALESTNDKVKIHVMLHDAEELTASVRHRNLVDDSSKIESGSEAYNTYRSCIPAVNEEKLSVLGFEGIMLTLLIISGSVVIFRRKKTAVMPGVVRANSRF